MIFSPIWCFLVVIKHDEKAVVKQKIRFGESKVMEMCQVESLLRTHHVGLGLLK